MINSSHALASALAGTSLGDRKIAELPILDTGERVYAVQIAEDEVESGWRLARSLVGDTGRWPLVVCFWGGRRAAHGWEDQLEVEDLFMRFPYESASPGVDVSPAAILRRADAIDIAAFLEREAVRCDRSWTLAHGLKVELDATQWYCKAVPSDAELDAARVHGAPISTVLDLNRWLLDWERARGCSPDPKRARTPWFQPGQATLLFLPVSSSWDSLAYIRWYGMERLGPAGAESCIALGREWSRRFGAELVANYLTMLQCLVAQPPNMIDDAWELARQHVLVAPATLHLPGIHVRHYALGLLDHDRWFLHERP